MPSADDASSSRGAATERTHVEPAAYPAAWEADIVLPDGTTTHLRPIRPDDADALQAFHTGQSERSTYLRFFANLQRLPPSDLVRFTTVDHNERVALVAVTPGDPGAGGGDRGRTEQIIGVARYDRISPDAAEVAFNVADAHHGRGLGSALLEHLAAAARERGVRRFTAEVLPQNGRMIAVFKDAGYEVSQSLEDGVVSVAFDIDPTVRSMAVMADREHRAEARSMQGLLEPGPVLVLTSAGCAPGSVDDLLVRRVLTGLTEAAPGRTVHSVGITSGVPAGVLAWTDLAQVPGPVDLAVLALPAAEAVDAVRGLARLGARGVVLLSSGFAETGPDGLALQREVLHAAHAAGMRVVGPGSFGIFSTSSQPVLNASLAAELPTPGNVGLFCQSGPMAVAMLGSVHRRKLGVSSFVSAGNRADVSGNDVMQFWQEDAATLVVGLYLESIGNPRKFSRVARRLASEKPVVVVTAGRSGQVVPPGHAVRPTLAPRRTLEEVLRQSGVIRADDTHQMLDIIQLLAHQPLPTGRRVTVVASSPSMAALVAEAAVAVGLTVTGSTAILSEDADDAVVRDTLRRVYDDPDTDAVIAVHIPTVGTGVDVLLPELAAAAAGSGRTTVACVLGLSGVREDLTAEAPDGRRWTVPAYATPENAVLAVGKASRYAAWRQEDHGRQVRPSGVDTRAARRLAHAWLEESDPVDLDNTRATELLACAGIELIEVVPVRDADEAVAAANRVGWPIALKTTVPALRHRADLGGVRLDVADELELRSHVAQMLALAEPHPIRAGEPAATDDGAGRSATEEHRAAPLEVQHMVPVGAACVLRSAEDPLFGPVISFGLAGDATDLLGDVSYGILPMTDVDVATLVRTPRAAPRLFGYRGLAALDHGALEDVISRLAALAEDLPELRTLELHPVVVGVHGARVLAASIQLATASRADGTRRALPT
jgi:acyl-CoA synthetase (NDP forming)/RimJ/RimL family protein N-acetyltransferase